MTTTPRVLVVEDHEHVLDLIREILESEDIDVVSAMDASEALEALEKGPAPDLILTRRLKGQERLRRVPIVAVTAYTDPGDREWFLQAGCDGYIPKPIDPDSFREEVLFYLHDAPLP